MPRWSFIVPPWLSGSTSLRGIIRGSVPVWSARMTPSFAEFKTVKDLDAGPLRPHIEPYITQLLKEGYRPRTVRAHLCLFANFNRWLLRTKRTLRILDEQLIEGFLRRHLHRQSWRAGELPALQRLLAILREAHVSPPAKAVRLTPARRLAGQYRIHLSADRGCSDWTVKNYGRHIDRLVDQKFGLGPAKASDLQARDIIKFVEANAHLHGRGHALQVVTALRSFLRFLRYRGHLTTDLASSVPSVAIWKKADLPKHLSAGAVQKVLDGCDRTTAGGRRNYAILLLLARLGLRAGEVIALRLEDIDWDSAQLTVRSKKGSGWARLPLPADVGGALAQYLRQDRPPCPSRNVFVRLVAPYEPLSNSPVIAVLTRKALAKAGVESARKGAHLFRHSLATEMLRQGASLDEIGQVLRHKDPDTTAIYAKVDLDALRKLAVAWPGGAR